MVDLERNNFGFDALKLKRKKNGVLKTNKNTYAFIYSTHESRKRAKSR